MKRWIVLFALTLSACAGSARHIAVVADQTIAQSVFAIDDAEFEACKAKVLSEAKCAQLNPIIKQALLDVKALTAAIQQTPKDAPLPKSLPALLTSLNQINDVVAALGDGPQFAGLSAKVRAANQKVIALLTQFAGGQ